MRFNVLPLLPFLALASAESQVHDGSFTPDYVLEATLDDIKVNCISRSSVTFNGTSPGPTLYLKEEQTTWIRVYNRVPDNNVTVVSSLIASLQTYQLTIAALAWPEPKSRTFLRRHSSCQPMAHSTQSILRLRDSSHARRRRIIFLSFPRRIPKLNGSRRLDCLGCR
jgi:hypothetical protein